jgi:ACS family tartrate transporter-like MFS transporter
MKSTCKKVIMTPNLEAKVIKKITIRLVPFLMLLYFIAYLDRINIGFAALTMNEDLGLSSAVFGLGAGIFFLGYFFFEVPSNLILHRIGARIWIARIMLTWGLISGAMAFVQGPVSFYVLRFMLGAAEAGFFPGIILYLSYWFPTWHRASVTAMFMAAVPISTAIGSPISGALLTMDGLLGIQGWQWLFIIEAIPALILSVVVWKFLTDRPEQAEWLEKDEREWLSEEMNTERSQVGEKDLHGFGAVLHALKDLRVLALALIYFGTSAGLYTLGIWAPLIISDFGTSPLTTGLLNAVPPIAAVIVMILWARHSDRTDERTWHVAIACAVAATGLLLAANSASIAAVIASLILVNTGVSAAKPPLWSMPTKFLTGAAAASGIAAINSIGNLGGFAGPFIIGFIRDRTGSFEGGLIAVAIALFFSAALVVILNILNPSKSTQADGGLTSNKVNEESHA